MPTPVISNINNVNHTYSADGVNYGLNAAGSAFQAIPTKAPTNQTSIMTDQSKGDGTGSSITVASSQLASDHINNTIIPALNDIDKARIDKQNADALKASNPTSPQQTIDTPTQPIVTPTDKAIIDTANTPDNNHTWIYNNADGTRAPLENGKPMPPGYSSTNFSQAPAVDTAYTANSSIKKFSDGTYGQFDNTGKFISTVNPTVFNDAKQVEKDKSDFTAIKNGTFPLTGDQQDQITGIQVEYAKMISDQQWLNSNNTNSIVGQNYLTGNASNGIGQGFVSKAISDGAAKIQDLNNQMRAKIADLKANIKSGNLATVKEDFNAYSKGVDDRQAEINRIQAVVTDQIKNKQQQKATTDDQADNDIRKLGEYARGIATPEQLQAYQVALQNHDIVGAQKALGDSTRERSPAGKEYDDYVSKAKQAGIEPILGWEEYQTLDANRKVKIAAAGVPGASGYSPQILTKVQQIAGNFDNEQSVKNYQVIAEGNSFVKSMPTNTQNPADQQAFIYAFAKIMDPGSVVREGEYATVQKYAQSWADNFGFKADRIFSNSPFLTEEAISNMKSTISSKAAASESNYKNIYNEYGRRINKITGGNDGTDFITDYSKGFGTGTVGDEHIKSEGDATTSLINYRNENPDKIKAMDSEILRLEGKNKGIPLSSSELLQAHPEYAPKKQSFNQVGGDTNLASKPGKSFGGMFLSTLGVETANASQVPDSVYIADRPAPVQKGIIAGYDITKYATDPLHEQKIASIVKGIGDVATSTDIDSYIKARAPQSPVTGSMVAKAADRYGVSPQMILALIQNDSSFGTKGKGARTKNPGNYGNDDTGALRNFKTWDEGVMAVASWLDKHRA